MIRHTTGAILLAALIVSGCNEATQTPVAKDSNMTNVSTTDLVFNVEGLT